MNEMSKENKIVVWGAGNFGEKALEFIGRDNISYFIDGNEDKQRTGFFGLEVLSPQEGISKSGDSLVVIATSNKFVEEIKSELENNNIDNCETISEYQYRKTREKILNRTNYIEVYQKAISWILKNTVKGKGIINNTKLSEAYPEVTGYYIPTLLRWGYKDLAIQYAKWLCSIQHEDGAWYDTEDRYPYIFDSAQILKGLIAIRNLYPEVDKHIVMGCDWILSNMTNEGRLVSPLDNPWGDGKTFSELIHTYCISPINEAGVIFDRIDYIDKAKCIAHYYTSSCRNEILNFDLLSHFYAYVMEAMLDIGEDELVREAMDNISQKQKESGAVPAYNNVDWVCSTGLFQLAIVWFRLGNYERGNNAFEYACKLQNESGGWFGSYLSEDNATEINTYFPDSEISWAVKYFLDALYYRNLLQFERQSSIFCAEIDINDGRYKSIRSIVERTDEQCKILDIGCGKGRYLKNLVLEYPEKKYFAVDLSLSVMKFFNIDGVEKKQGNLTDIPFPDNYFDVVYTCEALEHAVDIESAVRELCRVVKSGGTIAIVDKNKDMLGFFEIEEWEQWFDENELKREMLKYCNAVEVNKEINYDNEDANGLFYCWIGKVK